MFDAVAHTGAVLQVERDAPFVPLPDGQAAPPYPGHIIQQISPHLTEQAFTQSRSIPDEKGTARSPFQVIRPMKDSNQKWDNPGEDTKVGIFQHFKNAIASVGQELQRTRNKIG